MPESGGAHAAQRISVISAASASAPLPLAATPTLRSQSVRAEDAPASSTLHEGHAFCIALAGALGVPLLSDDRKERRIVPAHVRGRSQVLSVTLTAQDAPGRALPPAQVIGRRVPSTGRKEDGPCRTLGLEACGGLVR